MDEKLKKELTSFIISNSKYYTTGTQLGLMINGIEMYFKYLEEQKNKIIK